MESVEHSLGLKDGRVLAYHTFPEVEEGGGDNGEGTTTTTTKRHPVLYFHGFPGCGTEAGFMCALAVARTGGRVYGIDRPGMGKTSSRYVARHKDEHGDGDTGNNDSNTSTSRTSSSNLETFVQSVWELVEDQCWEEFSIIGASGGGPYALAMLASYLQRRKQSPARLRNVCLVGALCISAGLDGIFKSVVPLIESSSTSWWSHLLLRAQAVATGVIFGSVVLRLPLSWITAVASSTTLNKELPSADREWLSDGENNTGPYLSAICSMTAQGGYPGVYDDQMIVFGSKHSHEEVIRQQYSNDTTTTNSASTSINDTDADDLLLPAVGIFQGALDTNVPLSHALFLHKSVFHEHERSEFVRYDDLGHASMIAGRSEEYAAFATR
eukprot:CAMPEP_0168170616 /NCGR_PEP_ID=MMETSP0139_2-20121125/4277_1 /TAXON_ID=44445 /ORGANISM="Pseudo-nitzschia australis, Strain 10249 10 AB" /LENGTH=382 /DNA_ID=CAMNT_0008088135 /DNA_START=83 /DNA_END=1231 /DNA_ORIENTATION=-